MTKMNVSNLAAVQLAEMFVEFINSTSEEDLIKTYKGEVVSEDVLDTEGEPTAVGGFRLVHIFNGNNEYLTFTVSLYLDKTDDGTHRFIVYSYDKKDTILECIYNSERPSWIPTVNLPNVPVSSVTWAANKLKNVMC